MPNDSLKDKKLKIHPSAIYALKSIIYYSKVEDVNHKTTLKNVSVCAPNTRPIRGERLIKGRYMVKESIPAMKKSSAMTDHEAIQISLDYPGEN